MKQIMLMLCFSIAGATWGQDLDTVKISNENFQMLISLGEKLREAQAELSLVCPPSAEEQVYKLGVDRQKSPGIDLMEVGHPFEAKLQSIRIYGGTQGYQAALYRSSGEFTATTDFAGRPLREQSLEEKALRFRCLSEAKESPTHECWVIVSSSIPK